LSLRAKLVEIYFCETHFFSLLFTELNVFSLKQKGIFEQIRESAPKKKRVFFRVRNTAVILSKNIKRNATMWKYRTCDGSEKEFDGTESLTAVRVQSYFLVRTGPTKTDGRSSTVQYSTVPSGRIIFNLHSSSVWRT
jgi:hypothetical protein